MPVRLCFDDGVEVLLGDRLEIAAPGGLGSWGGSLDGELLSELLAFSSVLLVVAILKGCWSSGSSVVALGTTLRLTAAMRAA